MIPLSRFLVFLALASPGCGPRGDGPVAIRAGSPCERCGMEVRSLRFAAETVRDGRVRVFDSLECLAGAPADIGGRSYVTDYDTRQLIPLEKAFIVQGHFATPMGGGLAAFASERSATDVARDTKGQVVPGTTWRASWQSGGAP